MQKIKIGIHGSTGRMGTILKSVIENDDELQLGGLYSKRADCSLDQLFLQSDIIIDYALGKALPNLLDKAYKFKKPLVIASTGFDNDVLLEMKKLANHIPVFYAANMSYGTYILTKLITMAAKFFVNEEYDASIVDLHHRYKLDSPSGTAKMLAQIINECWYRNNELDYYQVMNPIKFGNITISSIKQSNIVGEYQVSFANADEITTLSHKVNTREVFAKGSIKAAKWLIDKPCGFYTNDDIFN